METNVLIPHNFAPSPDFRWLCQELFLKIDQIKLSKDKNHIRQRYRDVITRFVKLWRTTVGSDFYPVLILALPQRDRRVFQIKDVTLIKAVCTTLHLDLKSSTAQKLLDWKSHIDPNSKDQNKLASMCVAEIAKRRKEPEINTRNRVTLDLANQWLDQLAQQRVERKNGGSVETLVHSPLWKDIMNKLSYLELKYFFEIILKTKILRSQENTLLYIWHPDARDYLSVTSDLYSVTQKLFDPTKRLPNEEISLQLNSPFYPQLAKRIISKSYDKILNKITTKNNRAIFYIEEKMDGERIQIHYSNWGHSIKYFSRRGTDYTYLYGSDFNNGSISPYLKFNSKVENFILDGEMISFDKENNKILPFGMVKTIAKNTLDSNKESSSQHGLIIETNSFHPLYMIFDILYLNTISLINFPLWQRKQYLNQLFQHSNNNTICDRVKILPSIECQNGDDIKKNLSLAIKANSEGIILKNPQSKYIPASRNDSWIKIKPEYLDQFGENLDLIVMGRDSAIKDSYICGIATNKFIEIDTAPLINTALLNEDHHDNSSEIDTEIDDTIKHKIVGFVSFCSIANGLSKDESQEIQKLTKGKWHNFRDSPPPFHTFGDNRLFLKFGSKKPREWIYPKDSIILEVKARSIDNTESRMNKYATGCTLYGGYCKAIRQDKDWTSCYSMDQFKRDRLFKSDHVINNNVMDSRSSNTGDAASKRRKISPHFLVENKRLENDTDVISCIFQGLNFYIISDYFNPFSKNRINKENLLKLVITNGGSIVYNLMISNEKLYQLRIISDICNIECRTLIERGYDILSPKWILDCIQYKTLLPLEPVYCFSVSEELMKLAKTRIDQYGDSYQTLIDEPKLKQIIETNLYSQEKSINKIDLDNELKCIPVFLFFGKKFYVPVWCQQYDPLVYNLLLWKIKLYGGSLTYNLNDCSIIVLIIPVSPKTSSIVPFKENIMKIRSHVANIINSSSKSIKDIPYIVSAKWIDKSVEEGIQVPEELYSIPEQLID